MIVRERGEEEREEKRRERKYEKRQTDRERERERPKNIPHTHTASLRPHTDTYAKTQTHKTTTKLQSKGCGDNVVYVTGAGG